MASLQGEKQQPRAYTIKKHLGPHLFMATLGCQVELMKGENLIGKC